MLAHGSHVSIIRVGRELGKEYIIFVLDWANPRIGPRSSAEHIWFFYIKFYFANHRVTVRHIAKDGKDGRQQKELRQARKLTHVKKLYERK